MEGEIKEYLLLLSPFETGLIKQGIIIQLMAFSGDPDLYTHCGPSKPAKLGEYIWKTESSDAQESLFISLRQLQEQCDFNSSETGLDNSIYIAVRGS